MFQDNKSNLPGRLRAARLLVTALLLATTAIVLGPLEIAASAQDLPRRTDDWFRLESPHFTILSNSGRGNAERIVLNLEQLYAVFEQLKPQGPILDPLPTKIYLFRNDADFTPYKPLDSRGRPSRVAGYFLRHPFGNYVAINGDPRQDPSETIYHEFVHHFTATNLPGIPLWFNEGLAEFYSTFQVHGDVAEIGRPKDEHVHWLRSNSLLPLDQFLEVDSKSDLYRGGDGRETRRGVFYAQSWATAHYLLTREDEETRLQLADFFARLEKQEVAEDAFTAAFDRSLMDFEGELKSYVASDSFSFYKLPIVEQKVETELHVFPLTSADVYYHLGELLTTLNPPQLNPARRHFDAALKAEFGHGLSQAGLGRVASLEGDKEEAIERFSIAAEAEPNDFVVQYFYGAALAEALRDRSTNYPDASFSSDPDMARARQALGRSLDLRPDFAPALAMLGMTYLFDDEPQPIGLEILMRARRLAPERTDVLHNLALLCARHSQFDQAQRWIDHYLARLPESEEVVLSARRGLGQLKLMRVAKLANSSQLTEASRLATTVLPELRDIELEDLFRPEVERLLASIKHQEAVDLFNLAVDQVNQGDTQAGRAILVDLLERDVDQEITGKVRDALAVLDGRN